MDIFSKCCGQSGSVRVIDVFLDDLDLSGLGFKTEPNDTGRPAYHPSTMLKLFVAVRAGPLPFFTPKIASSRLVAGDRVCFSAVGSGIKCMGRTQCLFPCIVATDDGIQFIDTSA